MLRYSIGFFLITIVAALLGFGGLAPAVAPIAKIVFLICLTFLVLSLLIGATLFKKKSSGIYKADSSE